jgi:hypothetical protein
MSILKGGIAQGASGKTGGIYLSTRDGKTIIKAMPSHYKKPNDPLSCQLRKNTQLLGTIAKPAAKEKYMREIWIDAPVKGPTAFHKFFTNNHPGKEALDFAKIHLAPGNLGFTISLQSFELVEDTFTININPIGSQSGINTSREPAVALRGLLIIDGEDKGKDKAPVVFAAEPMSIPLSLEESLSFKYRAIPLLKARDAELTLIFMLCTLNSEENLVRNSVTLSITTGFKQLPNKTITHYVNDPLILEEVK